MKIPVIYAYPRSGGTLINRCLGSIPGNLVLSEVNPLAAVSPVVYQAQHWLNLLTQHQVDDFVRKPYGQQIKCLADISQTLDYHLIIRDWTGVNFIDNPIGDNVLTPSFLLEQAIYLSHYGLTPLPLVITRRVADVYESITRTFQHLQCSVQHFGEIYLKYAQAICEYPIFHYEQICEDPLTQINSICEILKINYDPTFIKRFHHFDRCTGDNRLKQSSKGGQLTEIKSLPSNIDSESYIAASVDQNCLRADKLLGYE